MKTLRQLLNEAVSPIVENIEDRHSEVCGNIEDHLEKLQSPHKERFEKKYDDVAGRFADHYENETGQEDEALGELEELEQELKAHLGH